MAHFRDTYRHVRFLFLDVRVGVILMASLLHIRTWTLTLDVLVIILAIYVERIGLGFTGTMRAIRAWISGSYRPALRTQKIRRKVDFERHMLAWERTPERTPVMLEPVKRDESETKR